ncbi:MAG: hypothetical protein ACK5LJ_11590 [Paracoccus sp. (in: a-proteobacteria)]
MRIVLLGLLMVMAAPALARAPVEEPAALCEWVASMAATESGVSADILGALTLTETGRRWDGVVRPWAWSVNAEGEGTWFDDPNAALGFAEDRVVRGRHNLDIGCFQLNYRWHGMNFSSMAEMFDPLSNARYAARFVSELDAETGDWRRECFIPERPETPAAISPGSTNCAQRPRLIITLPRSIPGRWRRCRSPRGGCGSSISACCSARPKARR